MTRQKTFVISVGGSLIAPQEGIDVQFLKKFRALIVNEIKQGEKFFLVTGGGATARQYINAAHKVIKINNTDKDWLGIHSTRLNAHLMRTIFFDIANPEIITNPTRPFNAKGKLIIAGGWRPGWSTDYVATVLAEKYKIKTIINLSNIDYAYDKDPKKFKNAKIIKQTDWKTFRKIVGNAWSPGLNMPFDPIASRKAQVLNLQVIIAGKNLKNLKNILEDKKFKGTVIS
ncbi:MAG: UMP kinase [Patescibacteria group bacterium]|nr:UMP kinase [Patescibacteria group bacterium]